MASTATQKGNRGQNKAIGILEKWTKKKFKSSSQSGMPGYNHDPHVGDILCKTEGHIFHFCVEVKNYRNINFCQLMQPNLKNVLILDFWDQVYNDSRNVKKIPMLFMRFDRLPANFFFVIITQEFAKLIHGELDKGNPNGFKSLRYADYSSNFPPEYQPLMILCSNALMNTDYKKVKEIAKAYKKSLYAKS